MTQFLPRLLVLTLVLAVLSGCGMMQKPTASITSVALQNVSATDATLLFDLTVDNPYTFSLPLGNVDYALASQGQSFASGQADIQGEVPAGGSKTLAVPVRISFVELIRTVHSARPGSTVPYTADLGLSVNVPALGLMRLPSRTEGQLKIPTGPDLLQQLPGLLQRP